MYIFDDYYKFNQTLLRILGLWPYGKTKFERFRAMFFYMLLISYTIVQFTQLAIIDFNTNVIIRILSDALPTFLFVIQFNMFFFETKKLKQILKEIINNQQMLTDAQEIKIVEHYVHQGKNITITFLLLLILAIFLLLIMEFQTDILDFFQPLNKSRTHYLSFLQEYHININARIQFYSLFFYSLISMIIGLVSVISVSMMLLLIALYCCAIFKICSYRIVQFMDKKEIIACFNKKSIIVERIIRIVKLHRKAQKIFKLFMSSFTISFLSTLIIGTSSVIANLYSFMNAVIYMDKWTETLIRTFYIFTHQFYLFGTTFMGQQIVNHADELFNAIYMSLWYKAPVTVQKLLLFIMQISSKGLVPNIGGVYVSVMESFTSVTNKSISFMMVIYSCSTVSS